MDQSQPKISPFIIKPSRINNYTHLMALLKIKQKKYSHYAAPNVNTSFSNVLTSFKESLDLDSVLEGFLHEKLKDKSLDFEKSILNDFSKSVLNKIKEIKIENNHKVYSSKIGNLKDYEGLLFLKPSEITFKDDLLFDLYLYVNKKSDPLMFLQQSYLKYILKYFTENSLEGVKIDNLNDFYKVNEKNAYDKNLNEVLKKIVKNFVKIRFNCEEFKIEVYESRYLWAEIFVLFRIGRTDLVLEIINEYEIYFEFMTNKFKSTFTSFINGKKSNFVHNFRNEDKFKKLLYEIADERAKSDGLVINTVEDYLWLKLISHKEIKNEISNFTNSKIKFMIALFSRKYGKAIDILLKSDFGIVPKFFLLRELCLEQSLDSSDGSDQLNEETINVFDRTNKVQNPRIKTRYLTEDSSSTTSLISVNAEKPVSTITPIFLDFLFNLISKLSTNEQKVKLVEMLKNHGEYYNIVPIYIIKYNLFDILGKSKNSTSNVEYALDDGIASRVLSILKEKGEKNKIIQLYNLIDDISMIQFLKEAVEEAILTNEDVDTQIVEKYLVNKISKDCSDLENMYGFYKFYKNSNLANLKTTVIFDQNVNLKPFRFVIEKIFGKSIEIVKSENDKQMAKYLFKLCGMLDLNEECSSKISKDLVYLI
jgi:hypothetical protein